MEFITRLICKLSVNLTSVGNLESISNEVKVVKSIRHLRWKWKDS